MDRIINLFFPRRCPVCDDITVPFNSLICKKCEAKIAYVEDPYCMKCGKPLAEEEKEYCRDCENRKHFFLRGRALYEYHGMAASIYRFKYQGRKEYARFYGRDMKEKLGEQIRLWNPQALVPVPIHFTRRRIRGYNQSELLARHLGKELGIPVNTGLIKRCRKTVPQKELNPTQRQNNLKKAFKLCGNDVKLKTIVIVDDIYTTGSTIDAMTRLLQEVGVTNVYYVTLAIGSGV